MFRKKKGRAGLGEFLALGNDEKIDLRPDDLCFRLAGSEPRICVTREEGREYPVRVSFIDALLEWHHLNRHQFRKASNETAISFFNDLLLAISAPAVRLNIEDGDAVSIARIRSRASPP